MRLHEIGMGQEKRPKLQVQTRTPTESQISESIAADERSYRAFGSILRASRSAPFRIMLLVSPTPQIFIVILTFHYLYAYISYRTLFVYGADLVNGTYSENFDCPGISGDRKDVRTARIRSDHMLTIAVLFSCPRTWHAPTDRHGCCCFCS